MHSPVSLFETGGRLSTTAEERRKNEKKNCSITEIIQLFIRCHISCISSRLKVRL